MSAGDGVSFKLVIIFTFTKIYFSFVAARELDRFRNDASDSNWFPKISSGWFFRWKSRYLCRRINLRRYHRRFEKGWTQQWKEWTVQLLVGPKLSIRVSLIRETRSFGQGLKCEEMVVQWVTKLKWKIGRFIEVAIKTFVAHSNCSATVGLMRN